MRSIRAQLSSLTALAAAAGCLAVLAAPASADTTTYPAGGSGFNTDAEGWTPGPATCEPATLLCTPESAYSATVGNPPGSIAEQTTVTLNAVSLFKGTETWISPQFAVPVGTITGASISLQRAFDPGGLIAVEPTATYTVTLNDLSAGITTTLLSEGLTKADSTFAARSAAAAVIGGHTYQLTIKGTTAQGMLSLAATTATTAIRFDNVALQVQSDATGGSGGPGGGPGGPGGNGGGKGGSGNGSEGGAVVSPGVRIVRGPLSATEIGKLIGSLNVNAEVGHHKGGSLIALSKCTIIGTPRRDRILGTKGNDVICGLGGNDLIKGRGGRDVIDGGNGNDRLIGGSKADLVLGLRGNDQLYGNRGNDRLGAGRGNDRIGGGPGNDLLVGTGGNDHLSGSAGNDQIGGGPGNDQLIGGKGNDRLVGRSGKDRMFGGPGKDRLLARDHGRDLVRGGGGSDVGILDHADLANTRSVEREK